MSIPPLLLWSFQLYIKLETGHSIECISYAGHSNACNMFLHFLTLCPFDIILIGERGLVIDYTYGKFGDYSFSRFGFIVQTDRQAESHTDADDRYAHATPVGISNNNRSKRLFILY